jgi:LmbE family N-acetylglucosaminyl deacetylase
MDTRHIYLSPHLDDVVLSCAGNVAQQAAAGDEVLVVTVFAGDPDLERLSPFARILHQLWGDPPAPVAVRRAEDRAVMRRLGVSYVHLGFLDAIYRGDPAAPPYGDLYALFGPPSPLDEPLVEQMVAFLKPLLYGLGLTILYAPLAVGHHVDHQLVNAAALRLSLEGAPRLCFYEDFPYAAGLAPQHDPDSVTAAQARLGGEWLAETVAIDLTAKIETTLLYRSQIVSLFGDEANMRRVMEEYTASVAVGTAASHAERFWQRLAP